VEVGPTPLICRTTWSLVMAKCATFGGSV
jgi:hypothetical protein